MKLPKLKREHTKLAVVALLASVLTAAPIAVIANAQDTQEPNPVLEMINEEEPVVEEEPAPEEPEETPPPVEETPPPVEEPPVEENEEPIEEPEATAVDILAAIAIAQAAHDEVADEEADVIMAQVKLKKLDEEKVFKVVFDDGWRIYVSADDGEIVLMKDEENKKRECGSRGLSAVAGWRAEHKKRWGHYIHDHDYKHKWDQPQEDQEEPVETEEPAEEQNN